MAKSRTDKTNAPAWPIWFKARYKHWGMYPVSWKGWVIKLLEIAGLIYFFVAGYMGSYTGSDRYFYLWLPVLVWVIFFMAIERQFSSLSGQTIRLRRRP